MAQTKQDSEKELIMRRISSQIAWRTVFQEGSDICIEMPGTGDTSVIRLGKYFGKSKPYIFKPYHVVERSPWNPWDGHAFGRVVETLSPKVISRITHLSVACSSSYAGGVV